MDMIYLPKRRKDKEGEIFSNSEIKPYDLRTALESLKEISRNYITELNGTQNHFDYNPKSIRKHTEKIGTLVEDISISYGQRFPHIDSVLERLRNTLSLTSEYQLRMIKNIERQQEIIASSLGVTVEEVLKKLESGKPNLPEESEEFLLGLGKSADEFFADVDKAKKNVEFLEEENVSLKNKQILERDKSIYLFEEILNKIEPLIPWV